MARCSYRRQHTRDTDGSVRRTFRRNSTGPVCVCARAPPQFHIICHQQDITSRERPLLTQNIRGTSSLGRCPYSARSNRCTMLEPSCAAGRYSATFFLALEGSTALLPPTSPSLSSPSNGFDCSSLSSSRIESPSVPFCGAMMPRGWAVRALGGRGRVNSEALLGGSV